MCSPPDWVAQVHQEASVSDHMDHLFTPPPPSEGYSPELRLYSLTESRCARVAQNGE